MARRRRRFVDPAGLNLRTTTGYESPGSSSYFRRTSRTLPAGVQTTYDYYSQAANAATAVDPCGTFAGNIPQGRALWKSTDAASRVTEFRYDSAGRTIGSSMLTRKKGPIMTWSTSGWRSSNPVSSRPN